MLVCGAGMENGTDLTVLRRHLNRCLKEDRFDDYKILLAIAAGANWPRARGAVVSPEQGICRRCSTGEDETMEHRLWTCPTNAAIVNEAVASTPNGYRKSGAARQGMPSVLAARVGALFLGGHPRATF